MIPETFLALVLAVAIGLLLRHYRGPLQWLTRIRPLSSCRDRQRQDGTLFIIIDLKPDYIDLRDKLIGDVALYSTVNNLKFGLNGPANVAPYVWIPV